VDGTDKKCIQNFGWKPLRKGPVGKPRGRWMYNIRIDLRELMWEGVDWMHLAQDRDQ
jgi:hypothetical protein